jgi:hypothetical protein
MTPKMRALAATLIVSLAVALLPSLAGAGGIPGASGDLAPITTDAWDRSHAAHLMERAGFGGTPAEIDAMAAMTPQAAVARLVRWQQVEPVPLRIFPHSGIFPDESFRPPADGDFLGIILRAAVLGNGLGVDVERNFGGPWLQPIFDQFFTLIFSNAFETTRLATWVGERMLRTNRPLEEKLALFWHGHFATEIEKVRDYRKMHAQWQLFREKGNGPFRELLLGVAQDPAMLIYLDGESNVRGQPNENFAREVMELFTLGSGNYSEADVREAARAFSGWGLDGNTFDESWLRHDRGKKTLLGKTGRFDGTDVVDTLLEQPAAGRFLAGKLYRFFVREDAPPELLDALGASYRESGYDTAALLEQIFLSRDFYSAATRGAHVKGPVELVVSTYRKLGLESMPGSPAFATTTDDLGQTLFAPPNVAGWTGGRTWINPSTLMGRQNFARDLLFPAEIPPLERGIHEVIVTAATSPDVYARMKALADQGQVGAPISAPEDMGFARIGLDESGPFDPNWAIWTGAQRALRAVDFFTWTGAAKFSLSKDLERAGVQTADDATRALVDRFLSVDPGPDARRELAAHFAARTGSSDIDWAAEETEPALRALLHLILSLPEYQLS